MIIKNGGGQTTPIACFLSKALLEHRYVHLLMNLLSMAAFVPGGRVVYLQQRDFPNLKYLLSGPLQERLVSS